MRILFVASEHAEPVGVSSLRRAFVDRDIEVDVVDPSSMSVHLDSTTGRLTVSPRPDAYSIVIHRAVMGSLPMFTLIAGALAESGTRVLNDIHRSIDARDKFTSAVALAKAGVAVCDAVASASQSIPNTFAADSSIVIKPARGAKGRGVSRRSRGEQSVETNHDIPESYRPFWIAQPFVETGGRDIRAFVVDGECVAAMRRTATGDEWRTNVALGARTTPIDPMGEVAVIAETAVGVLGLDYASVDILETLDGRLIINEVDPWGGFASLSSSSGIDVAGLIADLAVRRASTDNS